jgi:hypothetical protein
MKLGDHWRVAIEESPQENRKLQEASVTHQQTFTEQETAPALPQEAITK